jgi:hypothetical protein
MHTTLRTIILSTVAILLIIPTAIDAHNTWIYTSTANKTKPACQNPAPFPYVWLSIRLIAVQQCSTATGTVEELGISDDGDVDFLLRVDPSYQYLINSVNTSKQKGDLIVEIVCQGTITNPFAQGGCGAYKNTLPIPKVGDHISVTGAQVIDMLHGGWMEIHPVYSYKILK